MKKVIDLQRHLTRDPGAGTPGEAGLTRSDAMEELQSIGASEGALAICGGKRKAREWLAQAFHLESTRARRALIPVRCGDMPPNLLEAELFGYERLSLLELAFGGTLFLDDVAALTPALQDRLAHTLGELMPHPGATTPKGFGVRIIAGTNRRRLEDELSVGRLREPLYRLVARTVVRLPPFSTPDDDLRLVAEFFLTHRAGELRRPSPRLTDEAISQLRSWFPGPAHARWLRENLRQAIELTGGDEIGLKHVRSLSSIRSFRPQDTRTAETLPTLEEVRRWHIRRVLDATGGDRERAAEILGIDQITLRRALIRLGLE